MEHWNVTISVLGKPLKRLATHLFFHSSQQRHCIPLGKNQGDKPPLYTKAKVLWVLHMKPLFLFKIFSLATGGNNAFRTSILRRASGLCRPTEMITSVTPLHLWESQRRLRSRGRERGREKGRKEEKKSEGEKERVGGRKEDGGTSHARQSLILNFNLSSCFHPPQRPESLPKALCSLGEAAPSEGKSEDIFESLAGVN